MNFARYKRLSLHFFFSALIFTSIASPVYAVTKEIISEDTHEAVPVTQPIVLTTPKPMQSNPESLGPEKPTEIIETPTEAPSPQIPTPTITPTPTTTPSPTPTTAVLAATTQPTQPGSNTSTGGLNADVLFSMSNNYRAGLGLAPFQTDSRICVLAAARAPQIAAEISGGHMHSGKDSHGFPYRFTENIITMRSEAEAFNWWINDHIHRVQIEENNTHSCVACAGNACTQEFTSFQPK